MLVPCEQKSYYRQKQSSQVASFISTLETYGAYYFCYHCYTILVFYSRTQQIYFFWNGSMKHMMARVGTVILVDMRLSFQVSSIMLSLYISSVL